MPVVDPDLKLIKGLLRFAIGLLVIVMIAVACQMVRVVEQAQTLKDDRDHLVDYGRELVAHTSVYLGPKGTVAQISNGMNCQNCHLEAGTKPFGNNYKAVASTYPKFRPRSGTVEGFEKRINDCIERSLNGKPLNDSSREMKAIVAYLKWVGRDVQKGMSPKGSGLPQLEYLERAANPETGKKVYADNCMSCHGTNGQGVKRHNEVEWLYPPLWGNESYNTGAGLYRLSKLAAFVQANMPFGVNYESPQLSVEEAWDVAAYVNSMSRPSKTFAADWPNISQKPVDHPFGPYADSFSERDHKYGPFKKIVEARAN